MSLTDEQRRAAYAPGSVAVTAGAGTGKTHMLAERYLYHLRDQDLSPLEVVAVTFTDKAANELRSRIRQLATAQMSDRPDVLAELDAAPISTFHSLAGQICRDRADLLGIPADYRILDAIDYSLWFDDRIQDGLDRLPPHLYDRLSYSLLRAVLPALLDDPLSVRAAFERLPGDDLQAWQNLAQTLRDETFTQLQQTPAWQDGLAVLPQYSGTPNDSLEPQRHAVCVAMQRIEAGERSPDLLEAIAAVNLNRRGRKKNWKSGGLQDVRDVLKPLCYLVRDLNDKVALELTELDTRLAELLPPLNAAFEFVWDDLQAAKRRERVLSFSDLEVYALEALQHRHVRADYARRFKAVLADEFQDTNPIQGQLLSALTEGATLTIVGDAKQSIYSFRRAEIQVFQDFRDRIRRSGGEDVALSCCFRTHHPLIDRINRMFRPLLADLHQDLRAFRPDAPQPEPHLQAFALDAPKGTPKAQQRAAEAYHITQTVREHLAAGTPVFDKALGTVRAIEPGDIAILARRNAPLVVYAEALETAGIPIALAGGGNLLDTREAKDAIALLQFLCDRDDDRALVALLRSPFFAVSDRALLRIAQTTAQTTTQPRAETPERQRPTWWNRLQAVDWQQLDPEDVPDLDVVKTLQQLRQLARQDAPSRVLQHADRLTGYTAVLANLPGASRRLADWRGFREQVRSWEQGDRSLWGVVRRLRRLQEVGAKVERLPLDASNAVSLMTVHASKGLEWALVFLADASYSQKAQSEPVLFDPEYGVALKFGDDFEPSGKPLLYVWLERLQRQREAAETLRLLYVALTRSRDRLILTACEGETGLLAELAPGLAAADVEVDTWEFPEPEVLHFGEPEPPPLLPLGAVLSATVQFVARDLPLRAIAEFADCPRRFAFHYLQGHPGEGTEDWAALVRRAIVRDARDPAQLRRWQPECSEEALAAATAALQTWDAVWTGGVLRERTIAWDARGLYLSGTVLLAERDGETRLVAVRSRPDFALSAYDTLLQGMARALKFRGDWLLVDLPNAVLYQGSVKSRDRALTSVLKRLRAGDTTATPASDTCDRCPYAAICSDRVDSAHS